ncbi:hypothetical protein [Herbiconiux solani]|uniref:hypothetical protein n=1 Tax=Herbiconiux solani TaxID=661329 RepID=UPI0012ECE43F|nr:hypothetical protein [Herbiconiux solani]
MGAGTRFWRNRAIDFSAGVLTGLIVMVIDWILDGSFVSAPFAGLLVLVVMMFTQPAVRHFSERRWTDPAEGRRPVTVEATRSASESRSARTPR